MLPFQPPLTPPSALNYTFMAPGAALYGNPLLDTVDTVHFLATLILFLLNSSDAYRQATHHRKFLSFVQNVLLYIKPSSDMLLLSLKYIHRLGQVLPLYANGSVEFRIWVTSLMLADAFLNDHTYSCKAWAKVSGIPVSECAVMQREFLVALQYELSVADGEYQQWKHKVQAQYRQLHVAANPSTTISMLSLVQNPLLSVNSTLVPTPMHMSFQKPPLSQPAVSFKRESTHSRQPWPH
jgi:hypothetical protein